MKIAFPFCSKSREVILTRCTQRIRTLPANGGPRNYARDRHLKLVPFATSVSEGAPGSLCSLCIRKQTSCANARRIYLRFTCWPSSSAASLELIALRPRADTTGREKHLRFRASSAAEMQVRYRQPRLLASSVVPAAILFSRRRICDGKMVHGPIRDGESRCVADVEAEAQLDERC